MPTLANVKTRGDRLFSTYGVDNYADHDNNGSNDPDLLTDCANEAIQTVYMYVLGAGRYTEANVEGNELLSAHATILYLCNLCHARGNPIPMSLAEKCQQITALLEKIAAGTLLLPGVTRETQGVPMWSNLEVDRRYNREKVRVIPQTSSPVTTSLEQDRVTDVRE